MYFTGGEMKAPVMDMLCSHSDVDKVVLVDDNEEQRMSVISHENKNLICFHPDDENKNIEKIYRASKIKIFLIKYLNIYFLNKIVII